MRRSNRWRTLVTWTLTFLLTTLLLFSSIDGEQNPYVFSSNKFKLVQGGQPNSWQNNADMLARRDAAEYADQYFNAVTRWPPQGETLSPDLIARSITTCAKAQEQKWKNQNYTPPTACVEHYAIEGATTYRRAHNLECESVYHGDTNFTLRHIRRSLCLHGHLKKRIEILFLPHLDGGFVVDTFTPCMSTCAGSLITEPPYGVDFKEAARILYSFQMPWWQTHLLMDTNWGVVPPLINCTNLKQHVSLVRFKSRTPKLFWRGSLRDYTTWPELSGPVVHPRVRIPLLTASWIDADVKLQLSSSDYERLLHAGYVPTEIEKARNDTFMTWDSYIQHKYLLFIPGNADSVRLAKMLLSGSLIFFPTDHPFGELYWPMLRPWIHVVPVLSSGADLREKFDWAIAHETQANEIAQNALKLALYIFQCENLMRVTASILHNFAASYEDDLDHSQNISKFPWRIWPETQLPCETIEQATIKSMRSKAFFH